MMLEVGISEVRGVISVFDWAVAWFVLDIGMLLTIL